MSKPTLYSEAYRIAEEAHKGVDEDYLMELCDDAARLLDVTTERVYNTAQSIFSQVFA